MHDGSAIMSPWYRSSKQDTRPSDIGAIMITHSNPQPTTVAPAVHKNHTVTKSSLMCL